MRAYQAGASLVHLHVRNDDDSSSSKPERFSAVLDGIRAHCPGMIIQFSTGGRGHDSTARGAALYQKPDMTSLATGAVNFPIIIYENVPDTVCQRAQAMQTHLHTMRRLMDDCLFSQRPHVQFIMGIKNALPADEHLLDLLLMELKRLAPKATWTVAGIGRHQSEFMVLRVLRRGGDAVRTGLEDNIRLTHERLA